MTRGRCLHVAYNVFRPMRILIANDDGYLAPGLAALVQACHGLGDIDVVAPESNASGTSNALTLNRPLNVFIADGAGAARLSGRQRHAVGLRARGAHRLARAAARSRGLGHQQRRQHGRRHALLGHGGGGDGRLPVRHSGDRVFAGRQGLAAPRCRGAHRARADRARAADVARASAGRGCSTSTFPIAPMRRNCRVWSRDWAAAMPASR